MAGKVTVKGQKEEQLIEAACIMDNLAENMGTVLASLDVQEDLDHKNDQARSEVRGFLLDALKCYGAKDNEGMQKNVHAAICRLHEQEQIDLNDDKPRVDVKLHLSSIQLKAVHAAEQLRWITGQVSGLNRRLFSVNKE